ncbi:hypothetical protein [Chitinophaga rhizophila]|uniref:Uncharacterized protein n=1 Tax=Chitinophaga rhizophila TaxID=2866212 RepID=A0ABS7GHZ2_9BACT|nr:hypothetical protein [Chitinophaga rhizophila]MBW8686083.1 hypothetical protein [Chitinophaga rhizophila]
MRRVTSIVALLLIICLTQISAQTRLTVAPLYPLTKSSKWWIGDKKEFYSPVYLSAFRPADKVENRVVKSPLRPNEYYARHFGFFCKQEWYFEKQTQLPVKVRLGSYQEAQRLEGK